MIDKIIVTKEEKINSPTFGDLIVRVRSIEGKLIDALSELIDLQEIIKNMCRVGDNRSE